MQKSRTVYNDADLIMPSIPMRTEIVYTMAMMAKTINVSAVLASKPKPAQWQFLKAVLPVKMLLLFLQSKQ